MTPRRVLFLCTHNAARSQMAEGLLRHRFPGRFEAFSAGTDPTTLDPCAVRVMAELGIDISGQRSKDLGEFLDAEMDIGITVCDAAATTCPMLHGAKQTVHTRFRDPSGATGTEEERIAVFRAVRDEITAWIDATFEGAAHD